MFNFDSGTFGQVAWQTQFAGYRFSETSHTASLRLPKHSHDLCSINFVIDGTNFETCSTTNGEFEKHDLLLKPPGETHSNHFRNHVARCLLIEFDANRFDSLAESLPWMRSNVHASNPHIRTRGIRLLSELKSTCSSSRVAVESAVLELLLAVDGVSRRSQQLVPRWLRQVDDFLKEHRHRKISLDDIASQFGVYTSHLAREFRRYFHQSIGDYVRTLRIEDAMRILETTDLPIVHVAELCGFADQSHLGRWFKRLTGMTPRKYRQRSK